MQTHDYPMELGDYWRILVRRKFHFILPFVLVLGGAAALAYGLPPVYRSDATIQIQRQTIPRQLVATTVTGYVQEQIEQIRQQITARETLQEMAERFSLYPEELAENPQRVIRRIRDNIKVEMLDVRASDPDDGGRPRIATIAFTVGYQSHDPQTAHAVTEELSQRFLDIHRQARRRQAEEVTTFLAREAEAVEEELAELEAQMAGFKQQEMYQLPELRDMNMRLFESTEGQIEQTEERIRGLQDRIDATRAEMSLTPRHRDVVTEDGERILSARERLSSLSAQYLQQSARIWPRHPDMVQLRGEIRALAEQTGDAERADALMNEHARLQEELRQARNEHSESHPEVQQLEAAVSTLQRDFQSEFIAPGGGDRETETPPDNPRYVALQSQLNATEESLAAEQEKLANLRQRLEQYEERLYQTPVVEREFTSLTRGYEEARARYSQLTQQGRDARIAETLEAGQGGAEWRVVSSASRPGLPESPNRIGILLLGGLLAGGAGTGSVALSEYRDNTVRSARILTRTLGQPPLAVIPRMAAPRKRRKKAPSQHNGSSLS